MRASFHCPPVIAGGDDHRVDPVHDAFVVRGGAVGVDGGKGVGIQNAFDDLLAAALLGGQGLRREAHTGAGEAQIGQV
ncbi:hypothetical protein D3C71_2127780 [compost metagenome]